MTTTPVSTLVKAACALSLLLAVAACATQAQQADPTPPGRKIDAKTQLESGRRG